jgi:hypothetical protein
MKKVSLMIVALAVVSMISCRSLKNMDYANIASQINSNTSGASDSVVSNAVSGPVDFKSGEVLCSHGDGSMTEVNYYAARVLTKPSAATKNQAKVVFLDGTTQWINYIITSHKATKAEFAVGKWAFRSDVAGWDNVDQDHYRKARYYLGRITSTDELFKNVVEIDGHKCFVNWVRIPNIAIEE